MALTSELEKGSQIVSERQAKAEQLEREYDREFAKAYLAAEGPQAEKKYRAELAVGQLRADAEIARLEFTHAQRHYRGLETRLSAWQTVAKSIAAAYVGTTGRGR
ncbi:hypothetical protein ACFSW7_01650 [Gulosibacter faecalis]|uniref:Uncharacterized protein n=2 Tax=Gulosibacter faecalis TaxID=272240 RepID=A0ABW5UVT4_9MICO|nr:hypothetical protein [Gulosibacter faecalis]